jgi:hypothetical protein
MSGAPRAALPAAAAGVLASNGALREALERALEATARAAEAAGQVEGTTAYELARARVKRATDARLSARPDRTPDESFAAIAVASDGSRRVQTSASAAVGASSALSSRFAVDDAYAEPVVPFDALVHLARHLILHNTPK